MAQVKRSIEFPIDYKKGWREEYERVEREVEAFKEKLRSENPGSLVGEEVHFPVGDGYARYIVAKEKPLQLIHLATGDAWHADGITIRGLRLSDVKLRVDRSKKLAKLFPL